MKNVSESPDKLPDRMVTIEQAGYYSRVNILFKSIKAAVDFCDKSGLEYEIIKDE